MNKSRKGTSIWEEKFIKKGDFPFAVIGLEHGHIYRMCNWLVKAGDELLAVYDPDPEKVKAIIDKYPNVIAVAKEAELLTPPDIKLAVSASMSADRGELGLRVLDYGKHYFTDKPAFTT